MIFPSGTIVADRDLKMFKLSKREWNRWTKTKKKWLSRELSGSPQVKDMPGAQPISV
jgi:hypothetical protein